MKPDAQSMLPREDTTNSSRHTATINKQRKAAHDKRSRLSPRILIGGIMTLLVANSLNAANAAEAYEAPEDITFTAKVDGTTQKYVQLLPKGFTHDKPHSVMIALHGHGSDRWQFATSPRDECRSGRDAALKHDMIFVSPDYRAKTSWMGPKAEADLIQIIEELKTRHKIDKVILTGGSMGGSSTLSFTAMHPHLIDGVVAMNGTANHLEYENFQDAIIASFGGTKSDLPKDYKRRSAEYWPEQFTMPIAISTSGQDTSVPPDSCIRLAAILKKLNPQTLHIHRPATGHTTSYADGIALYDFVCDAVLNAQ